MKTVISASCVTAFAMALSLSAGCNSPKPSTTAGAAGTGAAGTGAAGTSAAGTAGAAGTGGTTGAAGTGPAGATAVAGTGGAAGSAGAAGRDGGTPDGGTDGPVTAGTCTPPANADQPFAKLSQTGCMDATNPTKMASIVIPYEVNSPLWSDNADKTRGFVIPAGKKIHIKDCATASTECAHGPQDTGKWVMPVGTVMVKSFGFDGKLVETRLLVHPDAATWNGYSYQWNEAQTEATIVPPDEDPTLNNMRFKAAFNTGTRTINWTFPYRFDCTGCHTVSAGGTLGPETRQMNRVVGGVGGMNQLDKWKALNLFEAAPKTQAALVLPYDGQLGTAPTGAATLEARARSYIHANCAYCHRPDSETVNWLDFRFDTTLKATGACGVDPMKGNVGVAGAQILKPAKPMESAMWLRVHAPYTGDKTRMPQLATYVVDDKGLALIGDWITSITACPP